MPVIVRKPERTGRLVAQGARRFRLQIRWPHQSGPGGREWR